MVDMYSTSRIRVVLVLVAAAALLVSGCYGFSATPLNLVHYLDMGLLSYCQPRSFLDLAFRMELRQGTVYVDQIPSFR